MAAAPAPTRPRSAAVVGAGIGGLTTALALRRTGWDVVVHERAAALEPLGAGLVLWPNAVRALDALDLGAAVRDVSGRLTGTGIRRPDGAWLTHVGDDRLARRHGAPLLAVERARLQAVLVDALGTGALRLDSQVTDVGHLTATHDLVVAADGARSGTRATLVPDDDGAPYAGYTAWRAVVPADVPSTQVSETWGRNERFGVVPLADGRVYVFATATVPVGGHTHDGATEVAELRRRFGSWHAPIPALLDALDPDAVLRHDVHALRRVPAPLHRGRVALLGDAAHAMEPNLGQGACLAIEDALTLAHAVADDAAPVLEALARWSAVRRPRVVALSRASARVGRLTQHAGPVLSAVRDTMTRLTPDGLALRASDGAAGWTPPVLPARGVARTPDSPIGPEGLVVD